MRKNKRGRVAYGVSKKFENRRPKMISNNTQHNRIVAVSKDNIKSQVETLLRTMGIIADNEDVYDIKFDMNNPLDVIPVEIKTKEEVEVKVI